MTNLMEEVLRSGTAAGVRARYNLNFPAAGKTGTSHDGWFAGFTSELLCVVWVGFDDNRELDLEGAHSAAPIWAEFMKQAARHPRVSRHEGLRRAGRDRIGRNRPAVRNAGYAELPHAPRGSLHLRDAAGGRLPAAWRRRTSGDECGRLGSGPAASVLAGASSAEGYGIEWRRPGAAPSAAQRRAARQDAAPAAPTAQAQIRRKSPKRTRRRAFSGV